MNGPLRPVEQVCPIAAVYPLFTFWTVRSETVTHGHHPIEGSRSAVHGNGRHRMTDGLNRRDFLARSAMAGAGVALIGSTEMLLTTPEASAATTARPAPAAGYGALVADPAGRLALPKGFSYTIVTQAGSTLLESGEFTPRNHDGTGTFKGEGGRTVLVNNHEIREPFGTDLPVPHLDDLTRHRRVPEGPRLRLRGGPVRPGGQQEPAADQGARPLRARGRGRGPPPRPHLPHRGRVHAHRPALPLGAPEGLPRQEGCCAGSGRRTACWRR